MIFKAVLIFSFLWSSFFSVSLLGCDYDLEAGRGKECIGVVSALGLSVATCTLGPTLGLASSVAILKTGLFLIENVCHNEPPCQTGLSMSTLLFAGVAFVAVPVAIGSKAYRCWERCCGRNRYRNAQNSGRVKRV